MNRDTLQLTQDDDEGRGLIGWGLGGILLNSQYGAYRGRRRIEECRCFLVKGGGMDLVYRLKMMV